MKDFAHFKEAAEGRGLEVALDLAFQCSPDHPYIREHPEWFSWRPDGTLKTAENPPKRYDDIVNFDFLGPARESLCSGSGRECGSSASTIRTPSHCRSGFG
jgi:starch synthase (maltosyl-transferring)